VDRYTQRAASGPRRATDTSSAGVTFAAIIMQTRFRPHLQEDLYFSDWQKRQEERLGQLTEQQERHHEQIKETNKKVEEQQALINELVKTSMSHSVFRHLAGITILNKYEYLEDEEIGELFKREFYYLKHRGFIGPSTLEFDKRLHKKTSRGWRNQPILD